MNIGVTGGSGFIGQHLVSNLLKNKHNVFVIDTQKPQDNNAKWMKADILNLEQLKAGMSELEAVYHLAAIADATFAAENPLQTIKVNVEGTANILEACRMNGVKRIIYASTIWVYNACEEFNVEENTLLSTNTKHIYTTSKLFGEFLCHDYHDFYGLDFTILRFGIPYGPGGRFNVIPVFIKKALLGETLTIRGTGEQRRQFIYVDDLASGCVSALKNIAENQVYNLAGNRLISVNEIVETIKNCIDKVKIERVPERLGELGDKKVSMEKAKRELGWEERTDFEEGLEKTINWYRNELNTV